MNSPTGGPELAQIVTIRDNGEEAQIAHLELTDQARAIVGHELVFTAIHKAARHGIHRLYSPRTVAHVEPFGFTASTDRPGMVICNITSQDMNWPEELSPTLPHDADVTVRYSAIQCRSADTTECLIMVSEHARTIDRHAVRVFARAITWRRTVAIDRLEAVIYARATVYICIGYDTQMRAEMPHRVRHLGGDADRESRRRG